ncbi:MAG: DUF763 domain-containing protein [Minisyncoccota bacterium]
MQRGVATFTLDYGKCPKWLFDRMVALGREMVDVIVAEEGSDEFIRRIADPVWFQSLGTVLAFDWNASGLTTILTAALKEAIRGREKELGIFICGGKGKTSLKVPDEITNWGYRLGMGEEKTNALIYNSKMSAKVDSSLVQDGYSIYHHSFFFSLGNKNRSSVIASDPPVSGERGNLSAPVHRSAQDTTIKDSNIKSIHESAPIYRSRNESSNGGSWAVVQQGMNIGNQTARRYHWYSENINDLVCEPHSGISQVGAENMGTVLNLVAKDSDKTRALSTEMVGVGYQTLMKDIQLLRKHSSHLSQMACLRSQAKWGIGLPAQAGPNQLTLLNLENTEFNTHPVVNEDFSKSKYLEKILWKVCDVKPENYEKLLSLQGVGPKTMRALALVGEVIYGAKPSYEDPARYSFAHGGKDATPYPVDCATYDFTINKMKSYVEKTKIAGLEKRKILNVLDNPNSNN